MPARLLFKYGLRMASYILLGDLKQCLRGQAGAVLRARGQNLRRLPRTLRKRRAVQRAATVSWRAIDALLTRRSLRAALLPTRPPTA
jgi:hypothetical protein